MMIFCMLKWKIVYCFCTLYFQQINHSGVRTKLFQYDKVSTMAVDDMAPYINQGINSHGFDYDG